MLGLPLIFFSIFGSQALNFLDYNITQQGCVNKGFVINTGGIQPWPPVPGQAMTVAVYGTFQIATKVQQYNIGFQYNNLEWVYWYNGDINVNYQVNQAATFSAVIPCPTVKGNYLMMVDLTAGSHIGCWILNFSL